MPLTHAAVRNAKGREKSWKLSDGGGLYRLIKPDGARYWRLAYRFDGKQKTLAIGVYPVVALADARAARDSARKLLACSLDPSQVEKNYARLAEDSEGAAPWCEAVAELRRPEDCSFLLGRARRWYREGIAPSSMDNGSFCSTSIEEAFN